MKYAIGFVLLWIFAFSVPLIIRGGWPILLIGILSILSGYYYTGGTSPYGYLGFGDLFVLLFFGPVSLAGTYFLQTLSVNIKIVIIGLGPGLLSVAILTVNNIRDMDNDRRSGKRTMVVRFGRRFGIFEYLLVFLIAALIPLIIGLFDSDYLYTAICLLITPYAYHAYQVFSKPADSASSGNDLNRLLGGTGKILILYGLLFVIALFIGLD